MGQHELLRKYDPKLDNPPLYQIVGAASTDDIQVDLAAPGNLIRMPSGSEIRRIGPDKPIVDISGKLLPDTISDEVVTHIWDRLFGTGRRVIVPCPYCSSHNAITNATCVQCGGPMGA
jgi:hypothetical protein